MKTNSAKYFIISLLGFFIFQGLQSQEYKNEVGFELLGLMNADVQLSYERAMWQHISLGLGVGLKSEEGLVKLSGLDTEFIETGDLTYSGFKIIPQVKYYLKDITDGDMTGFYFGAFLKLQRYNSDLLGTYTDSSDQQFAIDFDGKFNITSLGFMVGYKLKLSSRFNLDFLIAGPGVASHKYELTNREPLPDEFYDDLNDALNEYSFLDLLGVDFDFEGGTGETRESSFSLPAFRYAITLSYAF
jgi:hypothetical protein